MNLKMSTNVILNIFIIFLVLKTVTELVLNVLNRSEVLANKDKVPEVFRSVMDQATYDRSVEYTLAKNRFSSIETIYDALVLAFIILSGFLPWLFYGLQNVLGTSLLAQAFTFLIITVILSLFGLPFEWYSQFRLEESFGFNKSTLALWITDKLKGLALMFVIGVPLIWVVLKLFTQLPHTWWIWGFVFLFIFQILMLVLYPRLIMPLFNKLEPLKEGELKDRLMKLARRTGFKASTIQVIDGSKRSGHSNAFFTGFGKFRRIVLFDTLIEQLTPEELEAVLAHEIGHYKKGHVPKMIIISAICTFLAFAVIAWLTSKAWFFENFGFNSASGMVPVLILFVLLSSLVTFWFNPLMNLISRKHEYEADAFAKKEMDSPEPLILSLRKLSEKNLANLTPDKTFSAFYYSHPTLIEREKAMRRD